MVKRCIIGMLGGLMLLVGCSKESSMEGGASLRNPITFTQPILRPVSTTKFNGPVMGKYPQDEEFVIYAQWDKEGFMRWGSQGVGGAESHPYLDKVACRYDAGLNGWVTLNAENNPQLYDWPLEGGLTFAGYSPRSAENLCTNISYGQSDVVETVDGVSTTFRHSGLVIKNFRNPVNLNKQIDLMYGIRSYNKRSSMSGVTSPQYNGVDIVFHHALSLINFKFQLDKAGNRKAFLQKVTIEDVSVKGTFHEWVYESETTLDKYVSDNDHRKWKADKPNPKNIFVIFDQARDGGEVELKEIADFPAFATQPCMMIPQRFAKSIGPGGSTFDSPNAVIKIELRMVDDKGVSSIRHIEPLINTLSATWMGGKSYTYTVSVGALEIAFKPGVGTWDDIGDDVEVNPS